MPLEVWAKVGADQKDEPIHVWPIDIPDIVSQTPQHLFSSPSSEIIVSLDDMLLCLLSGLQWQKNVELLLALFAGLSY